MEEFLKVQMDLEKDTWCPGGWSEHTQTVHEYEEKGNGRLYTVTKCNGPKKYRYKIIETKINKEESNIEEKTKYKFDIADKFNFTKNNIQVKKIVKVVQWFSIYDLLKQLQQFEHYNIVFYKKNYLGKSTHPLSISAIKPRIYTIREDNFHNRDVDEDYIYTSIILEIPITKIESIESIDRQVAAEAEQRAEQAEVRANVCETRAYELKEKLEECDRKRTLRKRRRRVSLGVGIEEDSKEGPGRSMSRRVQKNDVPDPVPVPEITAGGRKRKSKKQRKTKRRKTKRRKTKRRKTKRRRKSIKRR